MLHITLSICSNYIQITDVENDRSHYTIIKKLLPEKLEGYGIYRLFSDLQYKTWMHPDALRELKNIIVKEFPGYNVNWDAIWGSMELAFRCRSIKSSFVKPFNGKDWNKDSVCG